MKGNVRYLVFPMVLTASVIWITGCYTQVGATREEYPPRDDNQEGYSTVQADTSANGYDQGYADDRYDDDTWSPGYNYGFDYYYPTLGFSFAYDPWWRYGGWYTYDPFWCGTSYPYLYAGWHYWNPSFHHYPYYGSYFYGGGGRGFHGVTRTIGSTRGGGIVRGSRGPEGVYNGGTPGRNDLSPGMRSAPVTRNTPSGNSPRVSTGRRSVGPRGSVTRGGAAVRGGTSRGGSRGGRTASPAPRTYTPPSGGGSRGGSGRTYSPPPSPPPAQGAPSGGSGGRSSGGGGGGSRGGRGR